MKNGAEQKIKLTQGIFEAKLIEKAELQMELV